MLLKSEWDHSALLLSKSPARPNEMCLMVICQHSQMAMLINKTYSAVAEAYVHTIQHWPEMAQAHLLFGLHSYMYILHCRYGLLSRGDCSWSSSKASSGRAKQ